MVKIKADIGWFSLRNKLIVFSMTLALVPLFLAGQALIRITRDELKSSANDEILAVAQQLSSEMDATYRDIWLAPLRLIANSLQSERMEIQAFQALLQTGVAEIPGVVSCQIMVAGSNKPMLVTRDDFLSRIQATGLQADSLLQLDEETLARWAGESGDQPFSGPVKFVEESGDWLLPLVIPLPHLVPGRQANLIGWVSLERLQRLLANHPFAQNGTILVVDSEGHQIFDGKRRDRNELNIVGEATAMLARGGRTTEIKPYQSPDGRTMLAGYAAPYFFPWAIILERDEAVAYRALALMDRTMLRLGLMGLALALIGAVVMALGISKPVEEIAAAATRVHNGDLEVRVQRISARDEIGLLGRRMNQMIVGLQERDFIRDTFGRFVTPEVASSVLSDPSALKLGGDLRTVTILMSDLRGFTSLSEQLSPAEMIDLLNGYLGKMADIIADYGGTVIEFIGDAVMALFGAPHPGKDDPLRAAACAAAMQIALDEFNELHHEIAPLRMGIGINTGRVIVGNIGSEKRMKYGVVGDDVNLTARVESFTIGGEVMVSQATHDILCEVAVFRGPMQVSAKGKKDKLNLYALVSVGDRFNLKVPHEHRAQTQLHPVELVAKMRRLKGKEVSEVDENVMLIGLADEEAELCSEKPLAVFDNIKLSIEEPGSGHHFDEIYAKATAVRESELGHLTRLVLTSIPEKHREGLSKLAQ